VTAEQEHWKTLISLALSTINKWRRSKKSRKLGSDFKYKHFRRGSYRAKLAAAFGSVKIHIKFWK